jgi:hypothetical protein
VDIGSNDGALLRGFKSLGMRVVGVEPALAIAQQSAQSGIPTHCGFFDETAVAAIRAQHGSANLITANNVFANIDDLSGVTSNINALLAPGGVFVIEFAYLGDLVRNRVFDYVYHEHLSYFSVETLRTFFGRAGMTIVTAEPVDTKGGSLRIYVQRTSEVSRPVDGVERLVDEERRAGLRQPDTYRALQNTVDANRNKCRQILASYKAEGKRIAGYGASVTCTTLIYHFGLQDFLEFLVDDNGRKHGTLCPGTKLMVKPSADLYPSKTDVVVVLAWRFADMIIERNKRHVSEGGVFVMPMPEVSIVGASVAAAAKDPLRTPE